MGHDDDHAHAHDEEPGAHDHERPDAVGQTPVEQRHDGVADPVHTQEQTHHGCAEMTGEIRVLEEGGHLGGEEERHCLAHEDGDVADHDEAGVCLLRRTLRGRRLPGGLAGRLPHRCDAEEQDRYADQIDKERLMPAERRERPAGVLQDENAQTHGGGLVAQDLDPRHAGIVLGHQCGHGGRDSGDADTDQEPHDEDDHQVLEEEASHTGDGEQHQRGAEGAHFPEPVGQGSDDQTQQTDGERWEGDDQRDREVLAGERLVYERQRGCDRSASHQHEHGCEKHCDEREPRRNERLPVVLRLHGLPRIGI